MKTANELVPFIASHPGSLIYDEIEYRGISQKDFADTLGISQTYLNEIIKGKRSVSVDFALLLEKALDIDADFWMRFQTQYEIDKARIKERNQLKLLKVKKLSSAQKTVGVKKNINVLKKTLRSTSSN